jgi:hypothetical protein
LARFRACPGTPDVWAFGTLIIREHIVTTPDGRVRERWTNPGFSEDWHFEIAADTWVIWHWIRRGMIVWDADGNMLDNHGVEAVAAMRNEETGEVLNWPFKWHFGTNGKGEPTVEFFHERCQAR